ncbi:Gfo/Idh/MocA family protein [Pleomorphovibrio marinus]|uniref:Gfo/Idh/MocA family protein n=1 Tax=Pleomorphovibrio marinus TaxID=2164132 RepID=UPI000E0B0846|nr:Gfo/Idh/MocA family oxidoreductase [Pleomorphovibrio marinus]
MKKFSKINRRKFLNRSLLFVLTPPFISQLPFFGKKQVKLRHVCVGVGGMGWHDLQRFMAHSDVEIVAICDVDENHLNRAAEALPQAKKYKDWRELLKNEKSNFDSINVSVPDHNHYVIAKQSMDAGKHVYCQKPMCHDVAEIRSLTELAQSNGVITQLGTQHASGKGDRTAVQWIKEGHIGKVEHVYLCSNRPGATEAYRFVGPRPKEGDPVPDHLDWELWTGTAPMRPYAEKIYHPAKWRAWQDFGTGWSGDIGCHILDAVWKGLDLKSPKSVHAKVQESWEQSTERRKDTWPQSNHITWVFPGNRLTASKELKVEWFDGEFYPPEEVRALYSVEDYPAESAMLVGTKGALLIPHTKMPVLLPEKQFSGVIPPELEERDHYHHFVDACLDRTRVESHFEVSGPMSETVILGTVAIRQPNTILNWDAKRMRFRNNSEADGYLKRTYREGWG